jgi:hypothetical protein
MSYDLSRYFIVKKFNDGWLMGSQNGPETIFVHRDELIRMGYLPSNRSSPSSRRLAPSTKVITIPIGNSSDSSEESKTSQREPSSNPINIPKAKSEEIIVDALLDLDLFEPLAVRGSKGMNRLSAPSSGHTVEGRLRRSSYPNSSINYLDNQLDTSS